MSHRPRRGHARALQKKGATSQGNLRSKWPHHFLKRSSFREIKASPSIHMPLTFIPATLFDAKADPAFRSLQIADGKDLSEACNIPVAQKSSVFCVDINAVKF
jgi:hypothetical protein